MIREKAVEKHVENLLKTHWKTTNMKTAQEEIFTHIVSTGFQALFLLFSTQRELLFLWAEKFSTACG